MMPFWNLWELSKLYKQIWFYVVIIKILLSLKKQNQELKIRRKKRSIMLTYKKILKYLTGFTTVIVLFTLTTSTITAQEEIDEEIYRKDSLIKRVGMENIDTSYTWEWDQDSSEWNLFGRNLKFFKQNQKLLAELNQRWNPAKYEFINHQRTIKSYNSIEKPVEVLEQEWDTTRNDWVNLQLRTMTYDDQGNKSEVLYQEWKKAVGRWVNTNRYLIAYNRMGERSNIVIKAYEPEADRWYNHQRYLFQYDGSRYPHAAIVEGWNRNAQEWQKKGRYEMKHNYRGQKTMESRATWNESLEDYIKGIRYLIDYEKRKKSSEILQHYDYTANEWNNRRQVKLKYNDEGELKEELTYQWNNNDQEWSLKRRMRYSMKEPELQKALDKEKKQTKSQQ